MFCYNPDPSTPPLAIITLLFASHIQKLTCTLHMCIHIRPLCCSITTIHCVLFSQFEYQSEFIEKNSSSIICEQIIQWYFCFHWQEVTIPVRASASLVPLICINMFRIIVTQQCARCNSTALNYVEIYISFLQHLQ